MHSYSIGRPAEQLFQARMRAIRLSLGGTQQQLADQAGLSLNSVSLIERGERSPTLYTMARIATALGVEVRELLTVAPRIDLLPEQMTIQARMTALCESFPTLRGSPGVRPWNQVDLEAFTLVSQNPQQLEAARFCLAVWFNRGLDWHCMGPTQSFDVILATKTWDDVHRMAFVDWAADPWLP